MKAVHWSWIIALFVPPAMGCNGSEPVSAATEESPLKAKVVAGVTAGQGERPIKGAPTPKMEWSAADIALREAMAADPSYTSGTGQGLTQNGAVVSWRRFLERDDLAKEQQAFAWWRLGALHSYNLDPTLGEKADYEQAEQAIAKTRELLSDLVTCESLNSATLYGTLPGKPIDRASRLATAFNWLATRSDQDVARSAQRINRSGNAIGAKFFPNIANRESTVAERKQFLQEQLAEYRRFIAERINQEIQYSQDPAAIAELLKSIEGAAEKKQMDRWRAMHQELFPVHRLNAGKQES